MKKNDDTIQSEEEQKDADTNQEVENVSDTEQVDHLEEEEETMPHQTEDPNRESEWEGKYKRALADYQNLEKRVAAQRRELIISAGRGILLRLLPVLDTLQLAAKHTNDKGLVLSIQQFLDILKAEGVEKIETKGKKFDPETMEAVGTGEGEENIVLEESRAGYLLNGSLLRAAQVIVGKKNDKE